MLKVSAVALVLVLLVGSAIAFLWLREADCQRELVDKTPQIDRIITLATTRTRGEVEKLFLAQVAGSATYKGFARDGPPGVLISNAGSGRGTSFNGYLGSNSED